MVKVSETMPSIVSDIGGDFALIEPHFGPNWPVLPQIPVSFLWILAILPTTNESGWKAILDLAGQSLYGNLRFW